MRPIVFRGAVVSIIARVNASLSRETKDKLALPERLTDRTIPNDFRSFRREGFRANRADSEPSDYHSKNSHTRYRTSPIVPVYDAKMTAVLEDKQGRSLWLGELKPPFWGSRYVTDSVVNHAARHIAAVLREME